MHFNQEARAKPLEHIIFILDLTVSQNINRFIVLTFYHSPYRKYGPFWEISCGADIERWWKYRTEKKYTILLTKRIKELRSGFLFNAVRPELHLSQAKPLITRSCFWTLLLFFLDYFLLSVVCEKFCPLIRVGGISEYFFNNWENYPLTSIPSFGNFRLNKLWAGFPNIGSRE